MRDVRKRCVLFLRVIYSDYADVLCKLNLELTMRINDENERNR